MNPDGARRIVLISFVVSGGVILYDVVKHGGSLGPGESFRAVWSLSLLFLLMAILADALPALAGPFAALVTLAIVIGRRGALQGIVAAGEKPFGTNVFAPTPKKGSA